MQQKLTISFGKLLVYILCIAVIVFAVKKLAFTGLKQKDLFSVLYQPEHKEKRPVYFTGTSRTQCGINDSLLNSFSSRYRFFNAGFAYGTFISNMAFANKLLNQIDSPVIFIELSVANGRMPVSFSLVSEPVHTISSMWPMLQQSTFNDVHRVYGPFTENYLVDYINLKPYLKIYRSNYKLNDYFGHIKKHVALQNNPGTFLLHKEVSDIASNNSVPPSYKSMIEELLAKAERVNSRIVFTLPLCINNTEEKERLLAIYNTLPDENKLYYSSEFLQEINNPAFLADDIHFNVKGAEVFTRYIGETINDLLNSPK